MIKSTYVIFTGIFLVLFLTSSAFAHPMSWWSILKITEVHSNGFSATYSGIKILSYAVLSLVIAIFINQSSIKETLKRISKKRKLT